MSDAHDGNGDAVYGRRKGRRHKKHTHQAPVDPTIEARRLAGLLTLGIHDLRCPAKAGQGHECLCGLDEARHLAEVAKTKAG